MRQFKTFAVAMMVLMGTTAFSGTGTEPTKNNSVDLSRLLEDQSLFVQKDQFCKVVFSLDENNEIQIHAILSKDKFLRDYITEKLEDKSLRGENWETGKVYILPLRMKK